MPVARSRKRREKKSGHFCLVMGCALALSLFLMAERTMAEAGWAVQEYSGIEMPLGAEMQPGAAVQPGEEMQPGVTMQPGGISAPNGIAVQPGAEMQPGAAMQSGSALQSWRAPAGHWNLGDVVQRSIGGETFRFRCIDENYSDGMANHRPSALFLCDTVIPADFGSDYIFGPTESGEHDYQFCPGKIVRFGVTNDYKYSNIRSWLLDQTEACSGVLPIQIGVDRAYTGSTEKALFGQLTWENLAGSYIGYQKMADPLFVLSVDEAVKYRSWLWRFEGSREENPETQYGEFCKGYWLRNPMGNGEGHDTGMVYVVDLLDGTIRPDSVSPGPPNDEQDEQLKVTGTIGVRPAFALAQ